MHQKHTILQQSVQSTYTQASLIEKVLLCTTVCRNHGAIRLTNAETLAKAQDMQRVLWICWYDSDDNAFKFSPLTTLTWGLLLISLYPNKYNVWFP